jgi:hypothetical protein
LLEVNHKYMKNLAGASVSVTGAVREHLAGITVVVRDQAVVGVEVARESADKAEAEAQEEARRLQREARAEVRQAEKLVHETVAAKYADMTKVELSDELGKRELPKTGNVDELRERPIEDDLHPSA